jgi:hypothetical protein
MELFASLVSKGVTVPHPLTAIHGPCIEIHEGLESDLFLFPESRLILKRGHKNSGEKVVREARWIQQLPHDLRVKFPRIVSINEDDKSYCMEASPYETVSQLLSRCAIDAKTAFSYWYDGYNSFLAYRDSFESEVPLNWEFRFFNKAQQRLNSLRQEFSFYAQLCAFETLTIDDNVYLNAPTALRRIQQLVRLDPRFSLRPPYLTLMHLDLQFTNILGAPTGILLDPAGDPVGDPLYDVMKAIHHTDHEHIKQMYINAEKVESGSSEPQFCISLGEYNADRCRHLAYLDLLREFDDLCSYPPLHLEANVLVPNWELRFWYLYATTMLGGTLHIARSSISEPHRKSVTRYILSIVYLNRFLSMLISFLRREKVGISDELIQGIREHVVADQQAPFSSQIITACKITSSFS